MRSDRLRRLARLAELEQRLPPRVAPGFRDRYPDLDDAGLEVVSEAGLGALAAADRVGIRVDARGRWLGDQAAVEAFHRAVLLAMDDAAGRARSGDLTAPRFWPDGPDPDPDYPAAIDALLVRAGWMPRDGGTKNPQPKGQGSSRIEIGG